MIRREFSFIPNSTRSILHRIKWREFPRLQQLQNEEREKLRMDHLPLPQVAMKLIEIWEQKLPPKWKQLQERARKED
jgi:hypothetical protein